MAKPKNQKPPFALRALAAFAVTLAALFVLLLAAYALPGKPVRDHVYDSAVKIAGEGLYTAPAGGISLGGPSGCDAINNVMLTVAKLQDSNFAGRKISVCVC